MSLVVFQHENGGFSESARAQGKAGRAGNAHCLAKRPNAAMGAGRLARKINNKVGAPVCVDHRVAHLGKGTTIPGGTRLVLNAHRGSELVIFMLKDH